MHSHTHTKPELHSHPHPPVDLHSVNLAFVIAVGANLAFTILEAIYGFITGSVALLGDAGHNLFDVLGLLLAWGASYLATRRTSEMYSYGFRRTTILAALINAVVLVFVASYIAWKSIEKFINPSPISEVAVMVVAGIGIVVNAGTAMLFLRTGKRDLNLRGAFLHLAYDALISAGVVIAAVVIYATGWLWIDGLMGMIIVGIIIAGTWGLLRDSVNLIIDAVPENVDKDAVRQYLEDIDGVTEVHDLHIWGMSTHENCLTAHLVMPENTLWESGDAYTVIGNELEQFNIHHVTIQVEKDAECSNTDCD